MFKRIGRLLALQFTGFVFLLLLLTGVIFLAADIGNDRRQTEQRLLRTAQVITEQTFLDPALMMRNLPAPLREHVRFLDPQGNLIFSGDLFDGVPFDPKPGLSRLTVRGEQYGMLTSSIEQGGRLMGYVQVADIDRIQWSGLPLRAAIFLIVSGLISAFTYIVGLAFARRSLAPAERMMNELEQFTQDASHELRTPLAALNSSLDLALKTGKHEEGIRSAKDDVKQITGLTERLLELARLDALTMQRETVNFSQMTEEVIERLRPLGKEKSIDIHSSIVPNILVKGDGQLLRQVVENLLSNAIKYSANGSKPIEIEVKKHSFRIHDQGRGIPFEAQSHIFDRFFQADPSRANGGFGLGLALTKRIVDLHGWSIDLESEEGKGTEFTVKFG